METVHNMKEILGEDFFMEEVRCDYLISAKMKRVWAVYLDMYLSFAEVCEKYGFKYFPLAGTLLGAMRHDGFIPWDDDMDVGMMREDYEEFLKVAAKDFKHPLFLQTPFTDTDYYLTWSQIRNSTTTGISQTTNHRRFNQGLFLDIFPIDFCNPDTVDENWKLIYCCAKRCGTYMRKGSSHLNERMKKDAVDFFTDNPMKEWETVQKIASNPEYKGSGYVCNAVFTGYPIVKLMFPASGFDSTFMHEFEKIQIPIPSGWEEQLKIQFGNYMEFPPIEARGIRHSGTIFDPDHPYTDYLE